jgi:DNA-binding PadR family transcriptional regulator
VKYAVLGLLVERRSYGYELMQRLERRLGPAWQLNPSTVYAALDQLEAEELTVCCPEQPAFASEVRGRSQTRRVVYEATAAGEQAFQKWVQQPSDHQEPIRSELLLKVMTARPEDAIGLLKALDRAEYLTRMLSSECDALSSAAEDDRADLATSAVVLRLEAELRWLQMARQALLKRQSRSAERDCLNQS